jgi:ketosteroid isomerase-like protein
MYRAFAAVALAVAFGGELPAQVRDSLPPTITLPAELGRVLTDYETAYPKGGSAVAELFVEEGYVLSGGRPPVKGRAAIAQHYGGNTGPLALRAFAYGTQGDIGYILGGYAMRRGDADVGKFTLTLKRGADGRWMIYSDMDNGNSRPGRPSPGTSNPPGAR